MREGSGKRVCSPSLQAEGTGHAGLLGQVFSASVECLGSESRRLLQVQAGVSASGVWGQTPAEPSRQVRTLSEQGRGQAGYGLNADSAVPGRTSRGR